MGEEMIWEIWRRLENSRGADFLQIEVAESGLGVFEELFGTRVASQVRCVLNFGTGCSIA